MSSTAVEAAAVAVDARVLPWPFWIARSSVLFSDPPIENGQGVIAAVSLAPMAVSPHTSAGGLDQLWCGGGAWSFAEKHGKSSCGDGGNGW
jgi:hypothetical protein